MSDKNWNSEAKLEDKLFTPIIKDMLEELAKNKELPSMIEFMYKSKRAYSQIHKVRNYLALKKLVTINKEGKDTKTALTPEGEKIASAFLKFLKLVRKMDR